METKMCPDCRQMREAGEFNFKRRETGLRQVYCRDCSRKYVREHYARNRHYYVRKAVDRNRVRRRDLMDRILE